MIKAVLFDLDGTLVDTLDDLTDATNYALEKNGYKTLTKETVKEYIGNGNYNLMERAIGGGSKKEIEKCLNSFFAFYQKNCAKKSKPYKDIVKLLKSLKENGILTCVVTNKANAMTQLLVPQIFHNDFTFDFILGQCPDIPKKPQPHMVYVAMNEIGVNADECFFVGDSYTDMLAGGNSGNIPVGVLWGYRDEKELKEAGARFIVSEPMQILNLIKEINS